MRNLRSKKKRAKSSNKTLKTTATSPLWFLTPNKSQEWSLRRPALILKSLLTTCRWVTMLRKTLKSTDSNASLTSMEDQTSQLSMNASRLPSLNTWVAMALTNTCARLWSVSLWTKTKDFTWNGCPTSRNLLLCEHATPCLIAINNLSREATN